MSDATIGLLHPGEMGAAVGQCLTAVGHEVLWVPEGRSAASAARAGAAGLTAADSLADLADRAEVILSVCPPHGALDVARAVAGTGFGGLYLDANAVSPDTAREAAGIVKAASYVDGGIIGTPPVTAGFIRLYLSGARAAEVRDLFEGTPVHTIVVDHSSRVGVAAGTGTAAGAGGSRQREGAGEGDGIGLASVVKMAYASWTKGSAALLLAARALARAEGVEPDLLAEWGISQPGLDERSAGAAASAAAKGWRWVAEMEEIAATMAAAGLPDGFHRAAAEIYRRAARDGDLDGVLDALISARPSAGAEALG
jgi:3-hydroxyisobutyrate dehydrogenase-like beta-hydroxyacid dehydrogenase